MLFYKYGGDLNIEFKYADMTMGQLLVFIIIIIFIIFTAAVQAAPDSGSDPHFPKNMDCCMFPDPKWDDYEADCSKYKDAFNKYGDPCAMDCVFNVSQVLPNNELNMVNARNLVSNLYNGMPDFIQTFVGALEKCQTRIKRKMVQLKAAGVTPHEPHGPSYCRPLPMMYVLCIVREVFINCPISAWTSSTECEKLKNYTLNCDHNGMNRHKRSKLFESYTFKRLEAMYF